MRLRGMVYYNAHPAWRDIYLQAKKAYGDEIILFVMQYHTNNFFDSSLYLLLEQGWLKNPFSKSQVMDIIADKDKVSDLKRMPLTLTLPDMLTPTMEISYYDYCFFISFWKVLYDGAGSFGNIEVYEEVRSQVSNIAESVFKQQYGLYFNRNNKPFFNEDMSYCLLGAFLGFNILGNTADDWEWILLQWIKDKDWPKKETPQEWFSSMWVPLKGKAPFMNWASSPFNKT